MDEVPEDFRELDLYEVLLIAKTATEPDIKRAYRRRALQTHPDKGGDATEFHKIAFAFSILGDSERRERYDEHGLVTDLDDALVDAFKRFKDVEITLEMIEEDKIIYREKEERIDTLKYYKQFDGDLDEVLQRVLHTSADDEDRIKGIIEAAIKKGDLQPLAKYKKSTGKKMTDKRKKTAAKEAKSAARARAKLGVNTQTDGDLAALIKAKQGGRTSFLDHLAAKYK